jgi:quercetin dioxygenase-like cupin family protein
MTAGTSENFPTGQIATKLLFENDNCRIWLMDLAPGESTDWHVHESDYVFVVTESAAPVECEFVSGRKVEIQNDKVGDFFYKAADPGHRLVNHGTSHYQNVVIELLNRKDSMDN